ncbi:MAG: MIF4G domain-containing protein [Acidobacteriaceae bacterium]|nr:MIF4G domain-containing protein [Acidobacteriaceae bacterium]
MLTCDIEKPTKIYSVDYLLQYRAKCQRRPKDMRAIEIPLKSNLNIKFEYQEVQRSETAEAVRNLRILLNKLSRDNFARITDTILNTFTFNQEVLEELARILFNKCVNEHKYIDVYMQLVDQLFRKFKVPKGAEKTGASLDFRRMFINKCQETFEEKSTEEFIKQLPTDIDEEEKKQKVRQRSLGNTKLIGQLFIRGVFLDTIVKSCLESFFKDTKEDNIEKACNLLLTIGRKLYEKFAYDSNLTTSTRKSSIKLRTLNKEGFDDYIDKLVAMKQTDSLSSRMRFMIQDVIDARNEEWNNAFDKFPVPIRGHDNIAAYRKKTKSIDKPAPPTEPAKPAVPMVSDPKIEQHELRKKSINEQNVFGRNIENYKKEQVEEHVRRRLCNAIDEYLMSKQISEVADTVAEVVDNEKLQKRICVGHFLLWGFSKSHKEFVDTYKMAIELYKQKHVEMVDVQEGYARDCDNGE